VRNKIIIKQINVDNRLCVGCLLTDNRKEYIYMVVSLSHGPDACRYTLICLNDGMDKFVVPYESLKELNERLGDQYEIISSPTTIYPGQGEYKC